MERGVFTLSLDFELVWGSRDLVDDVTPLVRSSRITRDAVFQALLDMFAERGVVGTWATVGYLFLGGGGQAARGDLEPPRHAWRPDWFAGVPEGDEAAHPAFYARSLVLRLRDAGQEVGSHSFSHPIFSDPGCPEPVADADLARCVAAADALGISLRSFVFPRNAPGHLPLLARHGFTCWRGVDPVWYKRRGVPGPVGRLAHLAEVALGACPPTVAPTRGPHGLWNIPASGVFLPMDGVRAAIPLRQRVRRAIRGIDRAVAQRRVSHLYIHPINFATATGPMLDALDEILSHAARRRDEGDLDILSMGQIAERAAA